MWTVNCVSLFRAHMTSTKTRNRKIIEKKLLRTHARKNKNTILSFKGTSQKNNNNKQKNLILSSFRRHNANQRHHLVTRHDYRRFCWDPWRAARREAVKRSISPPGWDDSGVEATHGWRKAEWCLQTTSYFPPEPVAPSLQHRTSSPEPAELEPTAQNLQPRTYSSVSLYFCGL